MSERFTCRLRLQVTPSQARALDARFEAARRIYNAVLSEMKRRLDLLGQSRTWHKARKSRRDKSKRNKLFAEARARYGFSRNEAIAFARSILRGGFAAALLGVHDVDCMAKRAFDALNRVALGKAHGARFKGTGRLRSLESESPESGIRYRNGQVLWHELVLPVRNHHVGGRHGVRHQARLQHALGQHICFARLIRARGRYYVQLVLQGSPLSAVVAGQRRLGIDLNVSNLAYAGQNAAGPAHRPPALPHHGPPNEASTLHIFIGPSQASAIQLARLPYPRAVGGICTHANSALDRGIVCWSDADSGWLRRAGGVCCNAHHRHR